MPTLIPPWLPIDSKDEEDITPEELFRKAGLVREAIQKDSDIQKWHPHELAFAILMSATHCGSANGLSKDDMRAGLEAILDLKKDRSELS